MSDPVRYFTLEQANAIVRAIRPLVGEILQIRQVILDRQPQVWPVIAKAAGNGGSKDASQMAQEFQRLDYLVREIQATGAVIKDTRLLYFDVKGVNLADNHPLIRLVKVYAIADTHASALG